MRGRPWFDLMRKVFHFLSQSLPPPLKVSAAASQWVVSSPHFSKSQLFVQASPNTKSQWVMSPPNPKSSRQPNTKMTISSDIGSVLHQPCAVPGLLQSRFAVVRSIIFQKFQSTLSLSQYLSLELVSPPPRPFTFLRPINELILIPVHHSPPYLDFKTSGDPTDNCLATHWDVAVVR